MNEDLYYAQVELEKTMRDMSISRFLKDHSSSDLSETLTGSFLIYNYVVPVKEAIEAFLDDQTGRAGRHNSAAKCLIGLEPEVAAYLTLKVVLNKLPVYRKEGGYLSVTSLAMSVAQALHDELRIRVFEAKNKAWLDRMMNDFNKRELPKYKRREYLQKTISDSGEDWNIWSNTDRLHVGLKMVDLFRIATGDIEIITKKKGKHKLDTVVPTETFIYACERIRERMEDATAVWFPMIIPPVPWSSETLSRGGYVSHHVTPYPLVKSSRKAYRRFLSSLAEEGKLDVTLSAINAIQETPWRVNKRVCDVLSYVYENNIECGKLPKADFIEPDPAPSGMELLPKDHPDVIEYRRYRAIIHEKNRRSVGKRVLTVRTLHMAERFSTYDRIYFPHDLDSRGRAYPKPSPLNPQGPDYVKGLLEFADGKPLGSTGLYWLGVHGANCFGEDKLPIAQRAAWAKAHIEEIKTVAANPYGNLWWTRADNPVQFLAFCFEYAQAVDDPQGFVSHIHVDLDATCSGLQHFSAMLRDEVGGFHVNMTAHPERQDVYGAVAKVARDIFEETYHRGGDKSELAKAWLDSGMMDRKTAKRPVMVKPYAGTLQSCMQYVRSAVHEKLEGGYPLPWAKEDMFTFSTYGGLVVWDAIPKVVVAADKAMRWLSAVARAVGKSQPDERRIEWTTPVGFPVWQYKFNMKSRQIRTTLDGAVYMPRLQEPTDNLDPRQMASSVPPSFVHSMDAAHLQLTTAKAKVQGMDYFAMVHDSFGVHATDVQQLSGIIREAFVEMYQQDVLSDFYESAKPLIAEEYLEDISEVPKQGNLDLSLVLKSEFFFS